jgi:hypothetical protein
MVFWVAGFVLVVLDWRKLVRYKFVFVSLLTIGRSGPVSRVWSVSHGALVFFSAPRKDLRYRGQHFCASEKSAPEAENGFSKGVLGLEKRNFACKRLLRAGGFIIKCQSFRNNAATNTITAF